MNTVLFCGNALVEYLPPYVIYRGHGNQTMDSWVMGGPEHCGYNVTQSGWMETHVFKAWFDQIPLKYLSNKPKPGIVFL